MRPALLLNTEVSTLSDRPLLSLRLRVVGITEDGEIRNYDGGGMLADAGGLAFGDLVIRAQYDHVNAGAEPYGWHVDYSEPYSVGIDRARAMVKLLAKVERGLAKREEREGYPETFAQYVVRVARIIGADRFGWSRGEPTGWYSTGDYHWTDASGLTSEIRSRVVKFAREHEGVQS